jgi:hypothetical protein
VSEPIISEDRTALSCTVVRARLQTLCSEISAIRYCLEKGPITIAQKELLDCLRQKCEELWTAATVRLAHDEFEAEDGHQDLLIMDQCPVGRPF